MSQSCRMDWSSTTQRCVGAPEPVRGRGKGRAALPPGGQVTTGRATMGAPAGEIDGWLDGPLCVTPVSFDFEGPAWCRLQALDSIHLP